MFPPDLCFLHLPQFPPTVASSPNGLPSIRLLSASLSADLGRSGGQPKGVLFHMWVVTPP